MNQKDKNKILRALCNDCDPKNEAFFSAYSVEGRSDFNITGGLQTIANGLSQAMLEGIDGESDKASTAIAWTIFGALYDAIKRGLDIEGVMKSFEDTDKENEDDFQEDCENCELNRKCNAPEAIEWRKANGIPKPKKGVGRKININ